MKAVNVIAVILVIVGALNWGLVALARFDLVAFVVGLEFGETNALSRLVYALVGVAGIYTAVMAAGLLRRHSPHPAAA